MSITVEATFEHGILRPKQPLDLAEGTQVRVTISPIQNACDDGLDPLDAVIGICTEGPDISLADRHDELL